jgi:hypothetical protein
MVETTTDELWSQAAEQIKPVEGLAAIEVQADMLNYFVQSLAEDLKAANITLSTKTCNALSALQSVSDVGTISDSDISTPNTSTPIQQLIQLKSFVRSLQKTYFALKSKLGLS